MTETGLEPAPGATALVIIDMINPMDFEGAGDLFPKARAAAERIAGLKDEARSRGVPVVYVNDNHGEWHSDRAKLIAAQEARTPHGRELVSLLRPEGDDIFILKPQFSGFYATNLPVLLPQLGASRLILTGVAADICVLFTAADAHMRAYDLWAPRDAVAAEDDARKAWALEIMARAMGAETAATTDLTLSAWLERAPQA